MLELKSLNSPGESFFEVEKLGEDFMGRLEAENAANAPPPPPPEPSPEEGSTVAWTETLEVK